MPERLKAARHKAVGAKQTLRALQTGQVPVVYVADDADRRVVRSVVERAAQMGVEVVQISTMTQLGKLCSIAVGAACAAVVVDSAVRHRDA